MQTSIFQFVIVEVPSADLVTYHQRSCQDDLCKKQE